ncbi:MAG: glycosyltransferase, partial [Rudaea sp.]
LASWSTRFVAVSGAVAGMLRRYGVAEKQIAVIPNGLDIRGVEMASRAPLSPELEQMIGPHSPVLVTLGRMSRIKGHDLLVEALARVRKKCPDVICICAGRVGSDEGVDDTRLFFRSLQSRIHQLGLDEHILFPGEIDCAPALLRRADVYVQPSRSESFCRAVAEAMICGTPVVAFRVGGLPEVVADGGILVDPLDVPALADSIVGLLQEELQRRELISHARSAAERFDVERVAPIFRDLVVSTAKRRPSGAS